MHIRIISPSGAIEPQYIDQAAARLQSCGHEVSIAPHAYDKVGRFAGTVEARLSDLDEALHNDSYDVVLCSRGGYGMAQYVDQLTPMGEHRPLVIGFSDITALHSWLGMQNVASVHGIMCKHIATLAEEAQPLLQLKQILRTLTPQDGIEVQAHSLDRMGTACGKLVGGNLSLLYGLRQTPVDILNLVEHPILFLEDIGERAYHVDRMMQNLRMSGVMEHLSGLVIGQFTDCDDDPSMLATTLELVRRAADPYDYPVCANFPAGHVDHNLPLFLNHKVRMCVGADGTRLEWV